jgi:hypothetical protein
VFGAVFARRDHQFTQVDRLWVIMTINCPTSAPQGIPESRITFRTANLMLVPRNDMPRL